MKRGCGSEGNFGAGCECNRLLLLLLLLPLLFFCIFRVILLLLCQGRQCEPH